MQRNSHIAGSLTYYSITQWMSSSAKRHENILFKYLNSIRHQMSTRRRRRNTNRRWMMTKMKTYEAKKTNFCSLASYGLFVQKLNTWLTANITHQTSRIEYRKKAEYAERTRTTIEAVEEPRHGCCLWVSDAASAAIFAGFSVRCLLSLPPPNPAA